MPRLTPLLLLPFVLAACQSAPPSGFESWRQQYAKEVDELAWFLAREGLAEVLPMSELLKSASSWQACRAEPYAVPPRGQWESVASVLRLVQALSSQGVIGRIEVFSGYRNPSLNTCAGGTPGSAHARSFALDFRTTDGQDPTDRLCSFWREQGRGWNMGFSRYPSGRIHVDTAGYRTWGADHTGKSAACSAA